MADTRTLNFAQHDTTSSAQFATPSPERGRHAPPPLAKPPSWVLGGIAALLCVATVACTHPTPDPSRAAPYWPHYDEVVALGTVEPDPHVPKLTPEPTPGQEAFEISAPESERASPNTWYSFVTAHCGIHSPMDFDGSYWIPIGSSADPNAEGINSTPGKVRLVDDQTLEFRTSTGFVARLRRHEEATWFWMCM